MTFEESLKANRLCLECKHYWRGAGLCGSICKLLDTYIITNMATKCEHYEIGVYEE